jgi:hypothetical protein
MLLFLSSGARPRYRDDVVRALALPPGAELQFRYERSIVSEELIDRIGTNYLRDQSGLVCYVATSNTAHPVRLVPCRFVTVLYSEIVGTSCILRLAMRDFAGGIDEGALRAVLAQNEMKLIPAWDLVDGQPCLRGKFAFEITATNLTGSSLLSEFERAVERLAEFDDFKQNKTVFYTVRGIVDLDRKITEYWPSGYVQIWRTVFKLVSGHRYEVEIYCFAPIEPPQALVKRGTIYLNSESGDIEFTAVKRHEIDSEYDLKRFRFYTAVRPDTFSTSLRIWVERSVSEDQENNALPKEELSDILLPVEFRGAYVLSTIRVCLMARRASRDRRASSW